MKIRNFRMDESECQALVTENQLLKQKLLRLGGGDGDALRAQAWSLCVSGSNHLPL